MEPIPMTSADLHPITPASSVSQTLSSEDTSNESGSKIMQQQSSSETPPNEENLPRPPLRFLLENRAEEQSRSTSTAAHQGSRDNSQAKEDSLEGTFSNQVEVHSNIPLGGDPRHILMRTAKRGVELEVLTFEPFNLRKVVRDFFEEKYGATCAGAANISQDSDDSLIQLDNPEEIQDVVHLDQSMISPESSMMVTSSIQRFPAATLEIISVEPSETIEDFSDLVLTESSMAESVMREDESAPEEKGEKEKRGR